VFFLSAPSKSSPVIQRRFREFRDLKNSHRALTKRFKMLGMKQDKAKVKREPYDLELEMKDPSKAKKLKEKIETRLQKLKQLLRQGESKEDFDHYGVLLHAYAALQKVFTKSTKK
jgi:hypothetical protein